MRLATLVLILAATATATASAQAVTTENVPHENSSVQWGRATAEVDATADEILAVITDYATYDRFMPQVEASRVLTRRGRNATVYLEATLLGMSDARLWAQLNLFARANQGDTRIIEGQMVEGNLERFTARWEVTPIEDGHRSRVVFQIIAEPDLPLPAFLVSQHNADAARWALQSLRRRVRQVAAARTAAPSAA